MACASQNIYFRKGQRKVPSLITPNHRSIASPTPPLGCSAFSHCSGNHRDCGRLHRRMRRGFHQQALLRGGCLITVTVCLKASYPPPSQSQPASSRASNAAAHSVSLGRKWTLWDSVQLPTTYCLLGGGAGYT